MCLRAASPQLDKHSCSHGHSRVGLEIVNSFYSESKSECVSAQTTPRISLAGCGQACALLLALETTLTEFWCHGTRPTPWSALLHRCSTIRRLTSVKRKDQNIFTAAPPPCKQSSLITTTHCQTFVYSSRKYIEWELITLSDMLLLKVSEIPFTFTLETDILKLVTSA